MERIIIPKYFEKSYLLSNRLNNFLDTIDIVSVGNKDFFDLDYLRKVYKRDRVLFSSLVLEMSIRGFIFDIPQKSSLFPEKPLTDPSYILKTDTLDSDCIKKEFVSFNCNSLLVALDSHVYGQLNNIPLEGFKNLFHTADLSLVKTEWEGVGAVWEKVTQDYICEQNNSKLWTNKEPSTDESKTEELKSVQEYLSEEQYKLIEIVRKRVWIRNLEVSLLKKSDKENRLIEKLSSIGCIKFMDLTDSFLLELIKNDPTSYHELLKLIESFTRKGKIEKVLLHAFKQINNPSETILNIPITELLIANNFNQVKKNLYHVGCRELNQLDEIKLRSFMSQKGMGFKKHLEFFDILFDNVAGSSSYTEKTLENVQNNKIIVPTWLSIYKKEEVDVERSILNLKFFKRKTVREIFESSGQGELRVIGDDEFKKEVNSLLSIPLIALLDSVNSKHFFYELFSLTVIYLVIQESYLLDYRSMISGHIKKKHFEVFLERTISKKTLQEIGEEIGVTRERVRQMEKIAQKKITLLEEKNVFPLLKLLLEEEEGNRIFLDEMTSDELLKIRIRKLEPNEFYEYSELLDRIESYDNTKQMRTDEKLNEIILKFDKHISYEDAVQNFKNKLSDDNFLLEDTLENIEKVLTNPKIGYSFENGVFLGPSGTVGDLLIFSMKQLGLRTIDLNDNEQVNNLWNYYTSLRDVKEDSVDTTRNIRGVLERTDTFIISNPSTFTIFDWSSVDKELFERIKVSIQEYLIELPMVNFKKIYEDYREELELYDLTPYMMYFIVKQYYSDEFEIGHSNAMNFYRKGIKSVKISDNLVEIVQNYPNGIHKNDLADLIGVHLAVIDQNIVKTNGIIMSEGMVYTNTIEVPDSYIDQVKETLDKLFMEKEYTSLGLLTNDLRFNTKVSRLFNSGDMSSRLVPILRKIVNDLPDYTISQKLITKSDTSLKVEDTIIDHFKTKKDFTSKEVGEFIWQLGYSTQSTYLMLDRLLKSDRIVEINDLTYTNTDNLELSEEDKAIFREFLEEKLNDKSFISLKNLKGYRRKLPPINYKITPHLISYIADKEGFNRVILPNIQSGQDPLIITSYDSKLTYDQLLLKELKEYSGNMYFENVVDYLVAKGLIMKRKNSNIVPFELKNSKSIYIDEIGMVSIND